MAGYLSGRHALADARMRLPGLVPGQGIVFVEGGDDVRLLAPFLLRMDAVIPCGNKKKLLGAFHAQQPGDHQRFVFVADCDYDVPAGRLRPTGNLLITERIDVEADLLALGLTERLVLELLPSAATSQDVLTASTREIELRATAVAEGIGRFRQVSAVLGLGLRFDKIRPKKYRTSGHADVNMEKLAHTLFLTNPSCGMTPTELVEKAQEVPGGPEICQGKDLLRAFQAVLHDDFKVKLPSEDEVARLLRTLVHRDVLDQWKVVERLRRWETGAHCRVLA